MLAAVAGAHYSGAAGQVVDALDRYGRNLGIAFQIVDDVLDLVGDENSMGKSLGTDLEKQKPTLPLIRLLQQATAGERRELVELLSSGNRADRQQVNVWLERSDALHYAREKSLAYARAARDEIRLLAAGDARDVLVALTDLVVSRQD